MLSLFTFITIWSEWFTSVYSCNIQDLVTHCHTLHQFSIYLFRCKFISVIPQHWTWSFVCYILSCHYPFLFNSEVTLFVPLKTVCDQSSHVAGINGFTSPYVAQVTQTTRDGWTLNFIRECMKINKVCSKSHSVKKKEIKISHLEFMLCVLLFVGF